MKCQMSGQPFDSWMLNSVCIMQHSNHGIWIEHFVWGRWFQYENNEIGYFPVYMLRSIEQTELCWKAYLRWEVKSNFLQGTFLEQVFRENVIETLRKSIGNGHEMIYVLCSCLEDWGKQWKTAKISQGKINVI